MSNRYVSQRFPLDARGPYSASSYHEERNIARNHRSSPDFRHDREWIPEDDDYSSSKYPQERRHISDIRIRERSFSPRERNRLPQRRSQEPDLREYLISSHLHKWKLLPDYEREGPNYNRTVKDYETINQNSDWKYDRNIDMKIRMDQESVDLRDRELLSRRDYRDEKYFRDSERDRRFSDLRDEHYDSHRDRHSSDHRDQVYLSEPIREDHFDYREQMYPPDSKREKHSFDFREEAHLSDFRKGWPSPDRRHEDSTDSARWHHNGQRQLEILTDSNRHWQNTSERGIREFERDWRQPDQSHQNYPFDSQRDLRWSGPRYEVPLPEPWRDRYPPLGHYDRSYNGPQGIVPMSDNPSFNELNHQGRRIDYHDENNWNNGHPHWNDKRNFSNMNNPEPENRRLSSFIPANNVMSRSEIQDNPFVLGRAIKQDGTPLPKFTVLIQYLYNFNQPLSDEHIEYVKKSILNHWNEYKMDKRKGDWLPRFLDCIPRPNGLAIVCEDRMTYLWLMNKKIMGYDGAFFAGCDASSPIKRVKLFFQIPGCDSTPNEVLIKLHQFNRGHQINFNRFKVLSAKKTGGNLNMVVLSDSWTANRLKKRLNWRPLYGNRRIRMNVMGKKKKKPSTMQPGEFKPKINEPANPLEEFDEMDDDSQSESYDEL